MKKNLLSGALALLFPLLSVADKPKENKDTSNTAIDSVTLSELNFYKQTDSVLKSLNYKTGEIVLSNNLATVKVPQGFLFLENNDARYILETVWGNVSNPDILGILVPENVNMLNADSWAIVFTYEEDGHIDDGDAADYDYDELLEELKKQTAEGSVERVRLGYQPIELIGWAKSPYYDKSSHKLHWAKEIKFGSDEINTLNYNIRMLGRKGVLVMNVVSGMDNLKTVENNMDAILASTNFNHGNRYEDFDSSIDKVAEYGIGGLIAGGILAKTGLLAKIGIFLLKAWKLIAVGVVGLFAALKNKLFGKKNQDNDNYNKLN